jgi:hypothetical protein
MPSVKAPKEPKPPKPPKNPRTKPIGKPEKPKKPAKDKPAKAERVAKVRAASKGKYKTAAEVRAVIAKIEATTDPLDTVLSNFGLRVG